MNNIHAAFGRGRRDMIAAFVTVSDLARRAGADEDDITAAHGRFFDGNVQIKTMFGTLALLAAIWKPRPGRRS